MTNLEKNLVLVREGKIDFGAFVAATRQEFRSMALYLMRRWPAPAWLTPEDVEQDLYLGVWKCVWDFEPSRGPTLSSYVVFGAMSWAKRELHKARGVPIHGSPDHGVSRFELTLSSIREGEALAELILAEQPLAEEAIAREEERREATGRALSLCESTGERVAILAIRDAGDLEGGAELLFRSPSARKGLGLTSVSQTTRFITGAARAVAERLDVSSAAE